MQQPHPHPSARRRHRVLAAVLGAAAIAGAVLAGPVASARELTEFDGTRAESQETIDGFYSCESWWFQDEGSVVQHVNTFTHNGRTVTYNWQTPSAPDVFDGQGSGSC